MEIVTEAEALAVISLTAMKTELRIPNPGDPSEHDALITSQIVAAVSFVSKSTGRTVADLAAIPALRASAVVFVRELYDGYRELPQTASGFAAGWTRSEATSTLNRRV